MYTRSSNSNEHSKVNTQKVIMLNGYAAIQYCTGVQSSGYCYTEDIELLFIKNGVLRISFGNENFGIGRHQLVLLKKNILVQYHRSPESACDEQAVEYIKFVIKYDLVKEFTKLAALPAFFRDEPVPVIVKQGERDCLAYMSSLDTLLMDNGKPADGLVKIKMLELFFHLLGIDKSIFEQLLDVREHHRTNITSTVEENITNALSVEQLAVLSGRSLSSFRRDFMSIYNMPPSQWIRQKRLEKAKELLLSTTMTITDICYTIGFENIAHFSRLFKSHCGYPPSNYKTHVKAA